MSAHILNYAMYTYIGMYIRINTINISVVMMTVNVL